jgi:hypothetical protein
VLFADLFFSVLIWYRLSSRSCEYTFRRDRKGAFLGALREDPIDLAGVDFIKENPGETQIRIDLRARMETANPRGKPGLLWRLFRACPAFAVFRPIFL